MKKISQNVLLLTTLLVLFFSAWQVTYAVTDNGQMQPGDYVELAPLPGTTDNSTNVTNLQTYLPGLFNFGIAIAGAMAFVVITFAGVKYLTVETIYGKSDARELINNALWGLLLVIGAWVILNTINPQILNFKLSIPIPPQQTTPTVSAGIPGTNAGGNIAGIPMTPAQKAANDAVLKSLNPLGSLGPQITPYKGVCDQGQTVGCVDLDGLQQSTVSGLQNLRNNCNCDISITGGTEPGHTAGESCHDAGTCVDIKEVPGSALDNTIMKNGIQGQTASKCTTYTYGGAQYLLEGVGATCGGTVASSGAHWHVTFH